jgi:two-component system response regulator AtoC
MATILIVDDEPAIRFALSELLTERGHDVLEADGGTAALAKHDAVDVVITDLVMPGMDGLALLAAIRARMPQQPVVLLTARGTEKTAVAALKGGAFDYLTKPFDVDELAAVVERAAEVATLRARDRKNAAERWLGAEVVGRSEAMTKLWANVERLASRDVPVLVTGETGTGKELVASLLHAASKRAAGALVRFNCAAIPSELAEAELFGHAKGAFTGATAARRGFFEQAHGGTLVLDEVGELPLPLQAKILRAVQSGEIQPVGKGGVEKVDVRIVACTNRDLREEVRAGRFREDLYFRIAVVEVRVPPLRERREDVAPLARAFAARFAERFAIDRVRLEPALIDALASRDWPGNVRELEGVVARLVATTEDGVLRASDLGAEPRPASAATFREKMAAYERALLVEALEASDGNQSEAARRLGLSRPTMIDRLKRLGL